MDNQILDIKREPFIGDYKRCMVITNYRCGSTYFVEKNWKQGYTNHYEIFDKKPYDDALHTLETTDNWIFKVMPQQKRQHKTAKIDFIERCIQRADKLVYLYRRDFAKQCISWIGKNLTGDWNHNPINGDYETHKVNITQHHADNLCRVLIDGWEDIKQYYNKFPGEVYCLDDYQEQKPYKIKYEFNIDFRVPVYDIAGIFEEK